MNPTTATKLKMYKLTQHMNPTTANKWNMFKPTQNMNPTTATKWKMHKWNLLNTWIPQLPPNGKCLNLLWLLNTWIPLLPPNENFSKFVLTPISLDLKLTFGSNNNIKATFYTIHKISLANFQSAEPISPIYFENIAFALDGSFLLLKAISIRFSFIHHNNIQLFQWYHRNDQIRSELEIIFGHP